MKCGLSTLLSVIFLSAFICDTNAAQNCENIYGTSLVCWVAKDRTKWCRTPSCEHYALVFSSDWHQTFAAPKGWAVAENAPATSVVMWVQTQGDIKVDGTRGNAIGCWWHAEATPTGISGVAGYCQAAATQTRGRPRFTK
jgi:hypothetical protein